MSAKLLSSVLGGFRQICLVSNLSTIPRTFITTRKSVITPFKTFSPIVPSRFLAHGVQLTKPMIEDRVMLVLRLYDKVDPDKVTSYRASGHYSLHSTPNSVKTSALTAWIM
ncbi:hypothetical protein MN116_008303 [Schistosoma mekongi]|uniref:Uncharacterized protein n=1 Tax=Schistosoma mekongi TaxID=38744 RepID=A0AAE1Z6E7_SCHME|nr:hypothetical protein MN116_008303 [Schistosoma mekongi]